MVMYLNFAGPANFLRRKEQQSSADSWLVQTSKMYLFYSLAFLGIVEVEQLAFQDMISFWRPLCIEKSFHAA